MGREIELKYAATEHQQELLFHAFGEEFESISMETVYYDTRDRQLSSRFITLRKRLENDISICTVKTPDAQGIRGEWECVCQDIHTAIPMLIAQGAPADLAVWCAAGLEPVCGARFIRRAKRVQLPHSEIELALDRGVLLGGGREIPLCEVEMELKSGTDEDLRLYAQHMAELFQLYPETRSKFQRAKALSEEV